MNCKTAQQLSHLTSEFYKKQAESFSATRTSPWDGWFRFAEYIKRYRNAHQKETLLIRDIACGNLRFEKFLLEEFPETPLDFYTIDNCKDLVESAYIFNQEIENNLDSLHQKNSLDACEEKVLPKGLQQVHFQHSDILEKLFASNQSQAVSKSFEGPLCDISVSFGFMHHIPYFENRLLFLEALCESTKPGGLVCVSFWQFMKNEKLALKAQEVTACAQREYDLLDLEENDYLIGWKDYQHIYRYCHHFCDEEINKLANLLSEKAILLDSFESDGRTGNLNKYIVFQVR